MPEYSAVFTRLILLTAFVSAFANPTSCIAHATGNIKKFSLLTSVVNLLIVPIAYLFLKLGFGPTSAMVVSLVITIIVQGIRIIVVSEITVLTVGDYIKNVVLPVSLYTVLSIVAPAALMLTMTSGWVRLLLVLVVSVISSLGFAWLVGLNKMEKTFVLSKVKGLKLFGRK